MQPKPKHTPTPWEITGYGRMICGAGKTICVFDAAKGSVLYDNLEANAARIVQCVNAHDVLVKALTAVMWHLDARLLASPDEHAQEAMDEGHAALEAAKVRP